MRGVAVVGTDTGVGKTVLCAALLAASPARTVYWKPVQTGTGEGEGDAAAVRRLARLDAERIVPTGCSFAAPASPHHAAALQDAEIRVEVLVEEARRRDAPTVRWVVEGVGGLLVPLGPSTLLPDLLRALGLPVLLAASTRLGTINHTLLTARELDRQGLETLGVVLVGEDDVSARTAFAAHLGLPLLGRLPRLEPPAPPALRAAGEALLSTAVLRKAFA
jgi:dethiobiotin synthetase